MELHREHLLLDPSYLRLFSGWLSASSACERIQPPLHTPVCHGPPAWLLVTYWSFPSLTTFAIIWNAFWRTSSTSMSMLIILETPREIQYTFCRGAGQVVWVWRDATRDALRATRLHLFVFRVHTATSKCTGTCTFPTSPFRTVRSF